MKAKKFFAFMGIAPILFSAAAIAAPAYSITPLSNDGTDCYIKSISTNGVVAGWTVDADFNEHAAFWDATGEHLLTGLSDGNSRAYGVNASGTVVGQSFTGTNTQATQWNTAAPMSPSMLDSLGVGSYSTAFAVNNAGNIVGTGKAAAGQHAIVWDADGTAHDYGSFSNNDIHFTAGFNCVNESGKTGGTGFFIFDPYHAAVGQIGSPGVTDVSTGAHIASETLGINNAGTMVGYNGQEPAIVNGDHTFTSLGLMDFDNGQAEGINDAGDIVGRLYRFNDDGSVDQDSFLYHDGQMYDLLNLLDSTGAGWTTLFEASAINQAGQIVGEGIYNGEVRPFVLNAVPEPTSLAVLGTIMGGFALKRGRR